MESARHYKNAPITEALIDIRVELPPEIGIDELRRAYTGLESDYPQSGELNVSTAAMQFGTQVAVSASSRRVGFWFKSTDGKQIVQARRDGFTLSRLAPYDRWSTFQAEARRVWTQYRAVVTPTRIERLAVRYINRIDIPLPLRDFKEYLRTSPDVSADLPQELTGYFMRLAIPQEDIKCLCLLNEAIIAPASPNVVSVVLDIDVFRNSDLPTDEDDVWSFIDELGGRKNQIFEACITDKARELFR